MWTDLLTSIRQTTEYPRTTAQHSVYFMDAVDHDQADVWDAWETFICGRYTEAAVVMIKEWSLHLSSETYLQTQFED